MQNKNFMNDEYVYKAYDRFVTRNILVRGNNNYYYRERFYDFVISCVKYVKYQNPFVSKNEAWKSINMDTIKERLSADLSKMNIAEWEDKLYAILIQFEALLEYEKVRYSHGLR